MTELKHIFFCAILLAGDAIAAGQAERKAVLQEPPEYPKIAEAMKLHGTVRLKIWISPGGSVRRVEYIGGHPLLAESALKAVKNWKYEAADKESTMVVQVKF